MNQLPEQVTRAEFDELKKLVEENTEMTKDMRDILATFRVAYAVAKWIAAVGAAVAAIFHGGDFVRAALGK